MAISAPTKSAQYTIYSANTGKVAGTDWNTKVRLSYSKLTFTAAGFTSAANGDLFLTRMPAGRIRILGDLSRVICPAATATSDLDIGRSAYTGEDNVAVTASNNAFADSIDVGGGAINQALATGSVFEISARSGWDLVCSFDTANSPASGDLIVLIAYQIAN